MLTLLDELKQHIEPEKAAFFPKFFNTVPGGYGEGDQFWGIRVPPLRQLAKKYRQLEMENLTTLITSPIHEQRLLALFILRLQFEQADAEKQQIIIDFYLNHLAGVNNWDLVDSSAHLILGRWLEDKPRDLLYELAATDHLWKQRIAMIATAWYIRNNDFTDALKIAEILMHHKHDLIHKAVGWMLREIGNRNFETEEAFLKQYYRTMPRTALRYAIEKFPEDLRQAYLKGTI